MLGWDVCSPRLPWDFSAVKSPVLYAWHCHQALFAEATRLLCTSDFNGFQSSTYSTNVLFNFRVQPTDCFNLLIASTYWLLQLIQPFVSFCYTSFRRTRVKLGPRLRCCLRHRDRGRSVSRGAGQMFFMCKYVVQNLQKYRTINYKLIGGVVNTSTINWLNDILCGFVNMFQNFPS